MGAYPCLQCGKPSDQHLLLCWECLLRLPPYYRTMAEHAAIDAALIRHAMVEVGVGGIRWSEQQYRDFLRKSQAPAPKEERKVKGGGRPIKLTALEPKTLVFELPMTPLPNGPKGLKRMHWRTEKRLKDTLATSIRMQVPLATGIPFQRARVEIVRYSAQEPDRDNLHGMCKPILDVLQISSKRHPYGVCVIEDDSPDHIDLVVRWEKASPRMGRVVVLVTPR